MSKGRFSAQAAKTFSVQLYNALTDAPIGAPIAGVTDAAVPTKYVFDTTVTGIVYMVATATNLKVAGYVDLSNPDGAGSSPVVDTYQETAAPTLNAADADAIALTVYQRLAGAQAALLNAPSPSADAPLDTIITADFDYTIPVVVADTSELIWFVRIRPRSTDALLIAKATGGLAELLGDEVPTVRGSATDASLTRTESSVTVHVAAAAMEVLPLVTASAELREVTAAGAQITRHEVQLDLRHSAGRVLTAD